MSPSRSGRRPHNELIAAAGSNPNGSFSCSWQFLKCDQPPQVVLGGVQAMDALISPGLTPARRENRRRVLLRGQ
ncbi:MAG: hypothetical protein KatS3mg061_3242 [Dehalococcoidia bacterium]|nr:MAG: hypothetical protein KatS3mg061_3242 [Dehalococcoidia bacterium]